MTAQMTDATMCAPAVITAPPFFHSRPSFRRHQYCGVSCSDFSLVDKMAATTAILCFPLREPSMGAKNVPPRLNKTADPASEKNHTVQVIKEVVEVHSARNQAFELDKNGFWCVSQNSPLYVAAFSPPPYSAMRLRHVYRISAVWRSTSRICHWKGLREMTPLPKCIIKKWKSL
jgi:hypothetical protein